MSHIPVNRGNRWWQIWGMQQCILHNHTIITTYQFLHRICIQLGVIRHFDLSNSKTMMHGAVHQVWALRDEVQVQMTFHVMSHLQIKRVLWAGDAGHCWGVYSLNGIAQLCLHITLVGFTHGGHSLESGPELLSSGGSAGQSHAN